MQNTIIPYTTALGYRVRVHDRDAKFTWEVVFLNPPTLDDVEAALLSAREAASSLARNAHGEQNIPAFGTAMTRVATLTSMLDNVLRIGVPEVHEDTEVIEPQKREWNPDGPSRGYISMHAIVVVSNA